MDKGRKGPHNLEKDTFALKVGLAELLTGGVIFEVRSANEAQIAEKAGAAAVVAACGLRMCEIKKIEHIQEAVSIPVIVKCSIGHFVEAQILEALFVDFIDESENLEVVDSENYIDKKRFKIPFACGCKNLGDALRHIDQGASLLHTKKAEGSLAETVRAIHAIMGGVRQIAACNREELMGLARKLNAPYELIKTIAEKKDLPVSLFASGGIIHPADVAFCMQLGANGVIIEPEIFDFEDPLAAARGAVAAAAYFNNAEKLAKIVRGDLKMPPDPTENEELFSQRGW